MKNRKGGDRREFLGWLGRGAGAAAVGGLVWATMLADTRGASLVLRPPGARPERDFLRSCIRCGLCVEACPYDTLRLAAPAEKVPLGTPHFEPRQIPCYMCEGAPCTVACPSAALDQASLDGKRGPEKPDIDQARMGVAVIDRQSCIAYWGLRCEVCYRVCPLLDRAITLELKRNPRTGAHAYSRPIVTADVCTGCGQCEHACVTESPAIRVLPREVALGVTGDHYILPQTLPDTHQGPAESPPEPQGPGSQTEPGQKDALEYLNAEDL